MTKIYSQEALALVNSEKARWAEIQFINAVDQLFEAQREIEKLKVALDEKNKQIDEMSKEK